MEKIIKRLQATRKVTVGLIGVVCGMVLLLGIRFTTYRAPAETHYHANFAVYIDGKQEQFSNPLTYEEISMCSVSTVKSPAGRAHMHEMIKDVVHVEDAAVTWGNFFQNIGWNVGNNYLATSEKLLTNTDTKKVTYMLNDKVVSDITTTVIGDKDRLLVSYGEATTDELNKQFATVATTAGKYDTTKDPASCSGNRIQNSLSDKFNHLF